jgi:hypothetical protein
VQLIQLLLPLYDNEGQAFPESQFAQVRKELTERFGGLTAYTRAPAQGLWQDAGGTKRDDIVVFEVMVAELDRAWWADYRVRLEKSFRQELIVIRAQAATLI